MIKARLSLALLLFLSMAVGVIAGQMLIPPKVQATTAGASTQPMTAAERANAVTKCYQVPPYQGNLHWGLINNCLKDVQAIYEGRQPSGVSP